MKIHISDQALEWFKRDVRLVSGDKVRFYTKIYGTSPIREGYALGFTVDTDATSAAYEVVRDGITFFINESDMWFFDEYELSVVYDEKLDEVTYEYIAK